MKPSKLDAEIEQRIIEHYENAFTYMAAPEEPIVLCNYEFESISENQKQIIVRLYQITSQVNELSELFGEPVFNWTRWDLQSAYKVSKLDGKIEYIDELGRIDNNECVEQEIRFNNLQDGNGCIKGLFVACSSKLINYAEDNSLTKDELLSLIDRKYRAYVDLEL